MLEQLTWLVGTWHGIEGDRRTEALWIEPAGGLMLGLHREVGAKGAAFFEYLRIVEGDAGLEYVAQPRGGQPTPFALKVLEDRYVVFENLEHDFPQRISYRLSAEGVLTARIEGEAGGIERSAEWRWRKLE